MSEDAFRDVMGATVKVGDVVAVARRDGNLADLRIGAVVELWHFAGAGHWPKARVRWLHGQWLPASPETTIDWHPERVVRVQVGLDS